MKKKLLFLAIFALLIAMMFAIDASAANPMGNYSMGDANMDGAINTKDVVLIKQSIVGMTTLTEEQKYYADAYDNGDGKINTMDVVLILQYIVGMDVELDSRVTVTFLTKDGNVFTTRTVKRGVALTDIPEVPQADTGYEAYWDFSGIDLSAITTDITVPCAEKALEYTVTYHLDGGMNGTGNPAGYTVESATKALADASKTGYTFAGWYTDASFKNKVTEIANGTTGNLDLYAKFDVNAYTISFNANGGSAVAPITQKYGTAVTAPAYPERSGYTFGGWYSDAELTRIYFFDTMPAENITVFAKWDLLSGENYTVSFCDWDGTVLKTQTVRKGGSAELPLESPERAGYRFDGWQGTWENVTENRIVIAVYVQQFEIQFLDDDGSLLDFQILDVGDSIVAPSVSKSGYRFDGWDKTFTVARENLTITAKYVKVYTVTFTGSRGELLKTEIVDEGADATPPPPAETNILDGFDFVGWDSNGYKNVNSNIMITALYQIKTYQVRFLLPDGTLIGEAQKVEHGSFAIVPEAPSYYVKDSAESLQVFSFTNWEGESSQITSDRDIVAIYDRPYTEPLILIKHGGTTAVLYFYLPDGVRLYAWEASLGYDMPLKDGVITITKVTVHSSSVFYVQEDGDPLDTDDINPNDDNQYVINNNEKYFTFAWTSDDVGGITIGRFDKVITFELDTQEVVANESNFTIDECTAIIGGENGTFEEIVPIVVYK